MSRRPLSLFCLAVILFLFLGTKLTARTPSGFESREGEWVELTGSVYKKESVSGTGTQKQVLYLHPVPTDGCLQQAEGVICYLKSNQTLPEMGSIVQVRGKLKCFEPPSNPGQFDSKSYYRTLKISFQLNQTEIQAKSNTYHHMAEGLYETRQFFSGALERFLSRQDASVMKTMLLGEKRAMDGEIKSLYQRNGIAHVLAISGLHVSLLGMTLLRLLKRAGAPPPLAAGIPAAVMVLYGFLTGFSVSALRATVMFVIHMGALLLKRTYDMVTAAHLAAVILLIGQPFYLFDSGFLFSFGCIFAIAFLVPALTKEWKKDGREADPAEKWYGRALRILCQGGAVTLAGLPLQLFFFYQTPVYATLLNLLVIPLMSVLMPCGIFLLLFAGMAAKMAGPDLQGGGILQAGGALCEWICRVSSLVIRGILALYEEGCRICESLPFNRVMSGRPRPALILLYCAVLLCVILFQKRISLKKRWMMVLCCAALLFLPAGGGLAVTFLDVGQGDCIHIKSGAGHHYLIDGGSSSVSKAGVYRMIPYLKYQGADEVEAVFVTHPDSDHCNGILELFQEGSEEGIRVKRLYLPGIGQKARNESYDALVSAAERAGVCVEYVGRGDVFRDGKMELWCLHPQKGYENPEPNQYSTVLFLQYGHFRTLLTGDVEGAGERELEDSLARAQVEKITVLKAAHHGSAGSTPKEILSRLSPEYTVISCGRDNSYGHPHRELMERLIGQGTKILITYESGAVTFRTDGSRMWVEEYLKNP